MHDRAPSSIAGIHLDAGRGAAALAVLAYHIRYKFFADYSELSSPTLWKRLFYVLTSFGHDAVMVFFVLSGYLITGTVLKDLKADTWSWRKYLINRLTRLYVVLIPGLLLTVALDGLGMSLFPTSEAYTGALRAWKHDFQNVSETLTPAVLFANLLFRQSIRGTPPLGSNGPLWSLTNEFAYYLIFPAIALAWSSSRRWATRLLAAAAAVAIGCYFGEQIALYFVVWLIGLGVRLMPPLRQSTPPVVLIRNLSSVGCLAAALVIRHTSQFSDLTGAASLEAGDFLVGLACGLMLYTLVNDRASVVPAAYASLARRSAAISYTLYVVHMPFLIFGRALLNHGAQWQPSPWSMAMALMLFAVTIGYASVVYYLFEARTDFVRTTLLQLTKARSPALQPQNL